MPIYPHKCANGHIVDILIPMRVAAAERNGEKPPRTCYHVEGSAKCELPTFQIPAAPSLKADGAYSYRDK